jgi:hypothetical protein
MDGYSMHTTGGDRLRTTVMEQPDRADAALRMLNSLTKELTEAVRRERESARGSISGFRLGLGFEEAGDIARQLYNERRVRDNIFDDTDLFGEPSWDILLDLFHARCAGVKISVSSACIAAFVPATTGLRWLSQLEALKLVAREHDPEDKRRSFVRITDTGSEKVEAVIRKIAGVRLPSD